MILARARDIKAACTNKHEDEASEHTGLPKKFSERPLNTTHGQICKGGWRRFFVRGACLQITTPSPAHVPPPVPGGLFTISFG